MITSRDLEWCAAFLEGEGSFVLNGGTPLCTAPQKEMEPLEKLKRLLGGNICVKAKINAWQLCGEGAAGVMMTLYPLMLSRRRGQIRNALTRWRTLPPKQKYRTHCKYGHRYSTTELVKSTQRMARRCSECWNDSHRESRRRRLMSVLLEAV